VKAVSTADASVASCLFCSTNFLLVHRVDLKLGGKQRKTSNARPERAPVYGQRSSNASFARITSFTYLIDMNHSTILYAPIGFEPTKYIDNILII
jgi:hypothetical protein